ncbi:MAG: hypothetical protein NT062_07140 [Proteobacteria bacterium]|nr:hypothetical protein [Pseudomonadota bacterium]
MKLGILVCGLCGLASAFLGDSVWAAREAMGGSVWAYVLGFTLASGVAVWRLGKPMLRWHAIVALIGTTLSLMVHRGALDELVRLAPITHPSAASLLYALGLYGGLIFGIGAVVKPEPR